MTHAAESTHWYDRAGNPAYTVPAKDGSERATTLRDARKLSLVPSVTTILKCADRPGLNRWMATQLMLAALTLPRLQDEPEDAWLKRVEQDSREQSRKASERGTAIHAAVQGFYDGEGITPGYEPHIQGAVKAVGEWMIDAWTAEKSFAHPLGFGGKCDLSCRKAVIDFKTKEFGPEDNLKTWDEHAYQLSAYREGLGLSKARCAIVYVSVTNPGLAKLIEIPEDDLERGWECFIHLLGFYKAKNNFRCGFEVQKAA